MRKVVAVNDRGLRIGEDHQRAKLTNAEVEMIRQLHVSGLSYRTLAEKYEVSKRTIAAICRYERRSEVPSNWKTVRTKQ